jgi:hypothetical protein
VTQTSDTEWIRRYRIEVSRDGQTWTVAAPSCLIDRTHRQPCRLTNQLTELGSSLLPPGRGTQWIQSFFEDFLLQTIEMLGPDAPYPDGLPAQYCLPTAVRPFTYGGAWIPGDCANFVAGITVLFSPEMAIEGQKLFPYFIDRFGFIPSAMWSGHKDDKGLGLDISGITWGPCCYWDIFAWSKDREYLRWFTDACATWARWWLANRDRNGDGWLEPAMNGCRPSSEEFRAKGKASNPPLAKLCPEFWDYVGLHDETHSAFWHMICEMPWDDSPIFVRGRHRGLRFDPETCSCNIHFIESQLYTSLLCAFVAHAYRRLGQEAESGFFTENAARLRSLVRENCWDEQTGFYYDRDIATGQRRTFVKHLGAFFAMMMGLPTQDQARRMVEHLTNPKEFWTNYPVPVVSRDSPDYSPFAPWCGVAWPPTNFFVLRGLLNYGYFDVADELLRRWTAHTQTCAERPIQYFDLRTCDQTLPQDERYVKVPDVQWIVPEDWHPESGALYRSGGYTFGALWLPSLIMRNFWPVGEHHFLLRPGGHLRLKWGTRWDVVVDDNRAIVNGRSIKMTERATYLVDETTGTVRALEAGKADPVIIDNEGIL